MLKQSCLWAGCVLLALLEAAAWAQSKPMPPQTLSGEWQLTTITLSIPDAARLQLTQSGNELGGTLYYGGEHVPVKGTSTNNQVRLEFKTGNLQNIYVGALAGGKLAGTFTTSGERDTTTGTWTAQRPASDRPPAPRTLEFTPSVFYRAFSAEEKPVLRIWPGDTVHTSSVDAGGQDEKSVQRVVGGNPLTGPFYVEGAMPGDVLAVHIKRLRLNRDWAMSDSALVGRAMTPGYAADNKQEWKPTRWHLDPNKQTATLEEAPGHLAGFAVAVHPMLGCVGVAPAPGEPPIVAGDSGDIGGNMDFSRITEGTTLFLQVSQPGALLYVGDGHALQGDGELNGDALETSMDIEFSVDVQREKSIGTPRAEDADHLMTIGLSGSLDNALRVATSEMAKWLQTDYKLSPAESAIVLGVGMEYSVAEIADRNVGVVAKIRRSTLASLAPSR